MREAYGFDIGFVLWDGSRVPADYPANAIAVRLADEGVVAALIRKPKIDTALDLWVTGRIDLRQRHGLRRVRDPADGSAPANSASASTSG